MITCINKIENCRRVISTNQYQTKSHRHEDKWLLRYLKDNGKKRDDVFDIWKKIYVANENCDGVDDDMLGRIFDNLWKNLNSVKLDTHSGRIDIYRSELDFINAQVQPKWIKEAMLVLLGYCKSGRITEFDSLPIKDILALVERSKRSEDDVAKLYDVFIDSGLMFRVIKHDYRSYDSIPEVDANGNIIGYFMGGDISVEKFKMQDFDKSAIVLSLNSIVDIKNAYSFITMQKKCSVCGKMFEYNSKTKRDICDACWRHNEVVKATERRNKRK